MEISLLVLLGLATATNIFTVYHLFNRVSELESAVEQVEFDSCKAVV